MTAKQEALLKKARRSQLAAKRLLSDGDLDFAASRAYYAMFYVVEAILLGKGLTFKSHSAVIAAFGQHLAATGEVPREFHQRLIAAQYARNAGDYWTDMELATSDIEEHIEHAQEFIELAERILRPQIK
jgi:uncharacterized protein (UPF0332 family)